MQKVLEAGGRDIKNEDVWVDFSDPAIISSRSYVSRLTQAAHSSCPCEPCTCKHNKGADSTLVRDSQPDSDSSVHLLDVARVFPLQSVRVPPEYGGKELPFYPFSTDQR